MYMNTLKTGERLVVGADMNGHVGRNIGTHTSVHGGFGYGARNRRKNVFWKWHKDLTLFVVNRGFKKSKNHLITFCSGPYESQIDYFSVRQWERRSIEHSKLIQGEPAANQHRLLQCILLCALFLYCLCYPYTPMPSSVLYYFCLNFDFRRFCRSSQRSLKCFSPTTAYRFFLGTTRLQNYSLLGHKFRPTQN